MKNSFSNDDKVRGEQLVSQLSEKAQKYYAGTSPIDVYQTTDGRIYVDFCGDLDEYGSRESLQADFEASYDDTPDGKIEKNWDAIANMMDDHIREAVHMDYAPCNKAQFLSAYVEKDPDFSDVLWNEWGIES